MVPFVSTFMWIADHAQYMIATVFGLTALFFSILAYMILRWILPSPCRLLFSPFSPFTSCASSGKNAAGRRAPPTPKKRDVKPAAGKQTSSSTARRRKAAAPRRRRGRWWEGISTSAASAAGTSLVLCALASALICAYSLTSQGCQTLRQLGLIEWLPWKTGLRCYRTRWDWMGELMGEVFLAVLRNGQLGEGAVKGV